MLTNCRKFFPPASEEGQKGEVPAEGAEEETAAAATSAEGEAPTSMSEETKVDDGDKTPTLDLPDVPKDAPTVEGQPQPKKAKLEDEGEKKE